MIRLLEAATALCAALSLTGGPAWAGPAPVQSMPESDASTPAELVARDARIEFDRRSAAFARVDLAELLPGDHGRAAALVALGAAGSVEGRALLVAETAPSSEASERVAATYALGELKGRLGPALSRLLELSADDDLQVANASLVALIRSGNADGRSHVAKIASGDDGRAEVARRILAHQADPTRSEMPGAFNALYRLRWSAARTYGEVDGKIWASTLLDQLAKNDLFLETLVLQLVRDLDIEDAKDHLLEILFDGDGARRVIVATQIMPFEIEALVDSGIWRPANWKEWKWLVLTILHDDLSSYFPRTLALSVGQPVTEPMAVGLLQSEGDRYDDQLYSAFEDEDPRNRAYAAYSTGASEAADFVPRLHELCDDPNPWPKANAIGALIRMGKQKGVERAIDVLAVPAEERDPRLTSYLFEVLLRMSPDPQIMRFVEEMAPRLSGRDRAAADSILLLNGALVETDVLRRELPLMIPTTPEAIAGVRALGRRPSEKDEKMLARLFPRENALDINLELAAALARTGHRSAEPLLQAAVWRLPWNQSVLAAGVVRRTFGERTLIAWAVSPPRDATEEDVRRVGYAIGEWGGMPAVEQLRRQLGTTGGAELPALQGAVLGALAARTR